jgi:DNA-binding CsgD family transcriptional regulator
VTRVKLTPREMDVRRLLMSYGLGETKNYKRLGVDLGITESRARSYVSSIRRKEREADAR